MCGERRCMEPAAFIKVLCGTLIAVSLLAAVCLALPYEPRFHARPPAHWINDPNGPYRDPITKKVHLYMQYNPVDSVWGNIAWYHMTSNDYVKWKMNGVALWNDKEYDKHGAYSGSITQNADGIPVLMYTCTAKDNIQQQCIAVPHPDDVGRHGPRLLNSFVKLDTNPLLTSEDVPGIVGLDNFRDPTSFWTNPDNTSEWLTAFVVSIKNEATDQPDANVVVFATGDPTWRSGFRFSHSIWKDQFDFYRMLECPDFFKLGNDYFLKVSTMISGQDYWVYGSYVRENGDGGKTVFNEDAGRTRTYIDYGRWYASKQNHDPILGRIVLWGWIPEEQSEEDMLAMGWSGTIDMPRNVEYDAAAKKLKTYPMPELSALRLSEKKAAITLGVNRVELIEAKASLHYEMVVDFDIPDGFPGSTGGTAGAPPSFGVFVRQKDDDTYTRIAVTMPPTTNMGMGYDQSGIPFKMVSLQTKEECHTACVADRRCVAWTALDMGDAQSVRWRCTLRSTLETVFEANASSVTGCVDEPMLLLDRTKSGTTGFKTMWTGRAPLLGVTKVQLRVFVDDSIIQVFKDGGLESMTGRVYVPSEFSGISLFSSNIMQPIHATVSIYEMDTVYKRDAAGHTIWMMYPAVAVLLTMCAHVALS